MPQFPPFLTGRTERPRPDPLTRDASDSATRTSQGDSERSSRDSSVSVGAGPANGSAVSSPSSTPRNSPRVSDTQARGSSKAERAGSGTSSSNIPSTLAPPPKPGLLARTLSGTGLAALTSKKERPSGGRSSASVASTRSSSTHERASSTARIPPSRISIAVAGQDLKTFLRYPGNRQALSQYMTRIDRCGENYMYWDRCDQLAPELQGLSKEELHRKLGELMVDFIDVPATSPNIEINIDDKKSKLVRLWRQINQSIESGVSIEEQDYSDLLAIFDDGRVYTLNFAELDSFSRFKKWLASHPEYEYDMEAGGEIREWPASLVSPATKAAPASQDPARDPEFKTNPDEAEAPQDFKTGSDRVHVPHDLASGGSSSSIISIPARDAAQVRRDVLGFCEDFDTAEDAGTMRALFKNICLCVLDPNASFGSMNIYVTREMLTRFQSVHQEELSELPIGHPVKENLKAKLDALSAQVDQLKALNPELAAAQLQSFQAMDIKSLVDVFYQRAL